MIAEVKAREIYNKMYSKQVGEVRFKYTGFELTIKPQYDLVHACAKTCALIAVDEIINAMLNKYPDYLEKTYWHPIDYWQQVKTEIEKL